jgi:hypothetical protein
MLNTIIEIIESPVKSFLASLSGAITGSLPLAITEITGNLVTPTIHYMQYAVWYLTAILAITSLVTWIQKQIDRYKKIHKECKEERNERQDNK